MLRQNDMHSNVKDDQHLLIDKTVLKRIVRSAGIKDSDIILEIGAGTGNLTGELALCAKELAIIEKDPEFVQVLRRKFLGKDNISIISGNMLYTRIPHFNKIVSNPPYFMLQQFFVRLIKERRQNFDKAVLVVPYGFAKKITAPADSPGFGGITAMFYAFYDVKILFQINKDSFNPKPRVTSMCISLEPRQETSKQSKLLGFVLRNIFLYDKKRLKNIILDALWNSGEDLVGKKVTKNEAKDMIEKVFEGNSHLLGKKMVELKDGDYSALTRLLASL